MTTVSTFQLESQRGKDAPDELLAFLRDNRGNNIEIDLQQVSTLSGPQIELILSAHREWQSEGISVSLVEADPEFQSRMTGFGIPSQLFSKEAE